MREREKGGRDYTSQRFHHYKFFFFQSENNYSEWSESESESE